MNLVVLLIASLTADDIRSLGRLDDVRHLPFLEQECRLRLVATRTQDIEEELAACLEALRRLEPKSATRLARDVLESVSDSVPLVWSARQTLAGAGDLDTIRLGLRSYFEEPSEWRIVLAEASARDIRLRDFSPEAANEPHNSERLLRSKIERNLGRAAPELIFDDAPTLDKADPTRVHEQILALDRAARYRAIRALAERDDEALVGLPIDRRTIDRLYPYFVESRYPVLRARVTRTLRARGPAVAALLLSTVPSDEEKRSALRAMTDAWSKALESRGVYEVMVSLVGAKCALALADVTALSGIPLPEARIRLEETATPEAIEALMKRPDRGLSVPVLTKLRQGREPNVRYAAEKALLALGAPGSTAFLRSRTELGDLLPVVLKAPIDGETLRALVTPVAATPSPSPESLAALFQLHDRYPFVFLSHVREESGPLAERFHFVLSLSGDPRHLPILVDLAVRESPAASREAAFLGLADAELGSFEKRLHRLAGHPDRSVRFRAAAAMTPSAEPWIVRLLLAELDESAPGELARAQSALQRIAPERARRYLEAMIWDDTATPFAVNAFLSLSSEAIRDRGLQRRMWELVEDGVSRRVPLALLAASRLPHPPAVSSVRAYLESRR